MELDVTDEVSVSAAAALVEREHDLLDIPVNNAGVLLERGQRPSQVPVGAAAPHLRRQRLLGRGGHQRHAAAAAPLGGRPLAAAWMLNLSSGLGSLVLTSDPDGPYAAFPLLASNASKGALNAVTVAYANELRGTSVKVSAADPGYCATDLNGHSGPRTAEQGAVAAVRLANLPADGPTAGFFSED